MVQMIQARSHSGRPFETMNDRKVPLAKAIQSVIEFELGFGGKLIKVDEKEMSVVTETLLFACRDTTKVVCEKMDEFKLLLEACYAHHQVFGIKDDNDLSKVAEQLIDITGGNALMLTTMAGPFIGGTLTRKKGLNKLIASYSMAAAGMSEQDILTMLEMATDNEIKEWIEAACAA